jgi:cob(I)alamin adenosyltransferase
MKIYTKTGDKGETGLADGKRYSKSDDVFQVMGEIDELIAQIGLCVTKLQDIKIPRSQIVISNSKIQISKVVLDLKRIQRNLFTINSCLAGVKKIEFDSKCETEWLEKEIDEMTEELPELRNFILPGGSEVASSLHVARAVCRRAERRMVALKNTKDLTPYINRLSDYLFTLARYVNFKMGRVEEIWKN